MDEDSCSRNHVGGIMKEESSRRNLDGETWKPGAARSSQEQSGAARSSQEQPGQAKWAVDCKCFQI